MSAILRLRDVVADVEGPGEPRRVLDGVSLEVAPGESLGLVGASGAGKSTLARLVVGLLQADGGDVEVDGIDVRTARGPELRQLRRAVQIILQDPVASLDPRMSVGASVAEPLAALGLARGRARRERVRRLLETVGLPAELARRRPGALSGGERQRVAIARALAPEPRLLVLDEPTSALDVSVQAQLLTLLAALRERHRIAYLLISHDLGVARYACDRIALIDGGRIVATAPTEQMVARLRRARPG